MRVTSLQRQLQRQCRNLHGGQNNGGQQPTPPPPQKSRPPPPPPSSDTPASPQNARQRRSKARATQRWHKMHNSNPLEENLSPPQPTASGQPIARAFPSFAGTPATALSATVTASSRQQSVSDSTVRKCQSPHSFHQCQHRSHTRLNGSSKQHQSPSPSPSSSPLAATSPQQRVSAVLSRVHQASILLDPPYRVLYHPLLAPPSGARTPTEAALARRATTVVSPRTPLPPPLPPHIWSLTSIPLTPIPPTLLPACTYSQSISALSTVMLTFTLHNLIRRQPHACPSAHAAIPTVPFRTLPNLNSFLISITSHPQSVQRRSRCERAQPFRGVRPSSAPRSSEPVPLSAASSVSASASQPLFSVALGSACG